MKAIISSTYDDQYLFYLPITTWCWNKLGVDVICFVPDGYSTFKTNRELDKFSTAYYAAKKIAPSFRYDVFTCPKHKEATYAQCARLYGACLDLPEDEILITSDIDMAVFGDYLIKNKWASFDLYGMDLVPKSQIPMCYISATVKDWRYMFELYSKPYQQCLDELLGDIECESFRGNYWGKDQETAYNKIMFPKDLSLSAYKHFRARPGTQFASNRVDRDDINWRSYVNDNLIDAHLWRPGYTNENFSNILELLQMKYPNEDFTWLVEYQKAYKALL